MSGKPKVGSLKAQKVKNKGKKVVKNILTLPNDLSWPLVNDEQADQINHILKEELSVMRDSKPTVPWFILMKLTKEQRKARIQQEIDSLPHETRQNITLCARARKYVGIGVNSCLRLMERGQLASCLIDSTVEPRLLVDKILCLARNKQVTTALVPRLSDTLFASVGFHSFILGFKKSLEDTDCPIKGCLKIKKMVDECGWTGLNVCDADEPNGRLVEAQERLSEVHLYRRGAHRVFRPAAQPTPDGLPGPDHTFIQISADSAPSQPRHVNPAKTTSHRRLKTFKSPLVLTLHNNQNKKRKK